MAARPKGGREDKICVAQIGAAHGLKGEVRLFSFTQNAADVGAYGPLTGPDGRPFEIVSLRPAGDHFVARFRNIDDRNAAEMLRHIELSIARDKLPPTDDPETFYHNDLIGLTATYRDGAKAGELVAVHNFGAGDLLEIRLDGSVPLECQRCLQAFAWPVAQVITLLLARDERELALLDEGDDAHEVILASEPQNALTLIEDEVLLALPFAPRCERPECAGHPVRSRDPNATQPSAFAALAGLKNGDGGKAKS